MSITLLNTKLKTLTTILRTHLQAFAAFAEKGRTNQSNLLPTSLKYVEDDKKAVLINLDQSMAFHRVDHQYLGDVLETTGFKN